MIRILHKDASMVVCIKPAGVLSESPGMPEMLSQELGVALSSIFVVHRLDRETAGVMVYALSSAAAQKLSLAFSEHRVRKTYLAVTGPVPDTFPGESEWKDLLFFDRRQGKSFVSARMRKNVKEAVLHYRILSRDKSGTLFCMEPLTGRTHQIRVQSASRVLPLLGDRRYGGKGGTGLALFACRLELMDGRVFEAMPPEEEPWSAFPGISDLLDVRHD